MTERDERGSSLVAALGVLSVLTLLATMSLMAGGADLTLSTRLARERSTFYAAESALETTMEELVSGGGPVTEASFHAPWPPPGIAVRRWQDSDWACSRRICLIPDLGDADGDPATSVVLFDRSFGHSASPLLRGGYPVLQVLVTAQGGESRQTIVAEVAPVTCAPAITAAWAAAGPLDLTGDIRIVGAAALPALIAGGPVRFYDGAVIDGELAPDPQPPQPAEVLRILNPGTLPRLEDLPEPTGGGNQEGLVWSRGDYSGPLDGSGIFIVHNPAFDPAKHEASRIAIVDGVLVEDYDPAYSHLDPSRQPAHLEMISGGSFSGVIIADSIASATAPFTLTGALVTLTRSALALTASSPLRIIGSRVAIERSGRGALSVRVGFRPVTAISEWPDQCP
jgi:hypothetical protein